MSLFKKKVRNHPLIKAWREYIKSEGGCIQCQNPWYDVRCSCGERKRKYEIKAIGDGISHLALYLLDKGWEL